MDVAISPLEKSIVMGSHHCRARKLFNRFDQVDRILKMICLRNLEGTS